MARKGLDTTLFRPRSEILQEELTTSGDMTPAESRPVKRASFDIYEDQLKRLGLLKYTRGEKISDMVKDALEEYLVKHQA